jgi:hypothetical protein
MCGDEKCEGELMFFSWESAMREVKRIRESGGKAGMQKRWYGWVVVEWPDL